MADDGHAGQAVGRAGGPHGCTAADLGRALGVSKQAAGKHIETLERLGYLRLGRDPGDARRKVYTLTDRAHNALTRSERSFARIHARWADLLGGQRLTALENDLRAVTPNDLFRFDTPQWFGS